MLYNTTELTMKSEVSIQANNVDRDMTQNSCTKPHQTDVS